MGGQKRRGLCLFLICSLRYFKIIRVLQLYPFPFLVVRNHSHALTYCEQQWTQSVQSILRDMQNAHHTMMLGVDTPVVEPPVPPQAPPVVPPPAGHANPYYVSYAQYEVIIHGQQALHAHQVAFESLFEDFATHTTDSILTACES